MVSSQVRSVERVAALAARVSSGHFSQLTALSRALFAPFYTKNRHFFNLFVLFFVTITIPFVRKCETFHFTGALTRKWPMRFKPLLGSLVGFYSKKLIQYYFNPGKNRDPQLFTVTNHYNEVSYTYFIQKIENIPFQAGTGPLEAAICRHNPLHVVSAALRHQHEESQCPDRKWNPSEKIVKYKDMQ